MVAKGGKRRHTVHGTKCKKKKIRPTEWTLAEKVWRRENNPREKKTNRGGPERFNIQTSHRPPGLLLRYKEPSVLATWKERGNRTIWYDQKRRWIRR